MVEGYRFFEDPRGTREEILRATYIALCEHGYSDLTVDRIGAEFQKSKSLIYHHYAGKDELLLDFLGYMLDHFADSFAPDDRVPADEQLELILEHAFARDVSEDRRQFTRAIVELRSQAVHDARYRAHFTRSDRVFADRLAAVIERGIEADVFRPVDPDAVAVLLITLITGSMFTSVTNDGDTTGAIRSELDALTGWLYTTGE